MTELQEQIVSRPEELGECLAHIAACRQFGFDTEFVGEDTYHPRLCLVQVATPERLMLIDPLTVGPLDAFWRLVVDPANLVIVHAGREEVRLCRLWTGQTPGNLFDLQIAAGLVGMTYPLGHGTLVNQLLRVQLAKGETLTEWRDRPLTRAQIQYAYDDVRYLLPLWQRLSARLEELGRTEWAREEFARLAANAAPDESVVLAGEKWRKLRSVGTLNRRQLAVVRELFNWREEMAAQLNRPARTIVRDDLIIEIARRNPARERDLQVVRGLAHRYISAVLQAVEQARTLAIEECPAVADREQDPPQVQLVTSVMTAILGDFCARNYLATSLVATTQDIKLLVRARMQGGSLPAESLLMQAWRGAHVLPELLAMLEGRRSLRIADLTVDSPFGYEDVRR